MYFITIRLTVKTKKHNDGVDSEMYITQASTWVTVENDKVSNEITTRVDRTLYEIKNKCTVLINWKLRLKFSS